MGLPLLVAVLLSFVATALAQSSPPAAAAPTAPSGYLPRTYIDPQGGKHPFFVFVPKTLPTAALTQAGSNAQYTEYPGVGHKCWDNAY